jgi:hypothetical protein
MRKRKEETKFRPTKKSLNILDSRNSYQGTQTKQQAHDYVTVGLLFSPPRVWGIPQYLSRRKEIDAWIYRPYVEDVPPKVLSRGTARFSCAQLLDSPLIGCTQPENYSTPVPFFQPNYGFFVYNGALSTHCKQINQ